MNAFESRHDRPHREGVPFEMITAALSALCCVPSPRTIEAV